MPVGIKVVKGADVGKRSLEIHPVGIKSLLARPSAEEGIVVGIHAVSCRMRGSDDKVKIRM